MTEAKGKYLYCVIKKKELQKFNILGQQGKEIHTINQGDLAMVVSDSKTKEYFLTREQLLTHQKVIEKVMQAGCDVLPVSFGMVAKDEEDIKEKLLKSKREELFEAFKKIEGRIELGLRAFWKNMPEIFQEIIKENKEIQIAKKQAQKNPSQFKVAAVGELVQKALEAKREKEALKIISSLKKLAVDFKERKLLGHSEVMRDSMIFNSAFLLSKANEKEFDKKIQNLIKEHDKKIKFIYVGPIPPFNFVELHLTV